MRIEIVVILIVIILITLWVLMRNRNVPKHELGECRDFVQLDQLCTLPLNINRACGDMVFVGSQSAFDKCGPTTGCATRNTVIYVQSAGQLARVDSVTQTLTVIGNIGLTLFDIAFGADGILYGLNPNGTQLYSLSLTTGAATLVGNLSTNLGENACGTWSDGYIYGIWNNQLRRCKPPSLTVTTVRTGLTGTLGDIAFIGKDMYWSSSGSGNSLYKITGPNLATGPISVIGPCDPELWGLAHVNCELWGTVGFDFFKISTIDASTTSLFTVAAFGGPDILGATTRDSGLINGGAYLVNIYSFDPACLPMSFTTNQTLLITITDPSLNTQIALLAGGSFTVTAAYVITSLVNGWINV
jgi:hypothetical protein